MGSYPESILRVGARGGRSEQEDSYFSRTWLVKWKLGCLAGEEEGEEEEGLLPIRREEEEGLHSFLCCVLLFFFFWVFCCCPFPIA
ncbi:hypothetical protein LINPERHAP2_LOCUS35600 [Linum perenne]